MQGIEMWNGYFLFSSLAQKKGVSEADVKWEHEYRYIMYGG